MWGIETKKEEKKGKKKKKNEINNLGKKTPRKKGPSGKPKLYFINKKSEKEAYEAAKLNGKGEPIKHAHPKKGKPHFHPNNNPDDVKGLDINIKKNGYHYMYPK